MRKYKRSIARANMIREGYQKINATRRVGRVKSFFAENWRDFVK